MRIARKVARVAAKAALIAVAVVTLLLGIAWSFLQTRRGGELVRRIALPRVNAALAGSVGLDRFAFGGDRLVLENLSLRDPEGRPVLRIARVDVAFSPLALLRRHVDIARLTVRRPQVTLVQEAGGLNLARALAPRHPEATRPAPEAATTPQQPSRIALDVHALVVSDGELDYRSGTGTPETGGVHVSDLSVEGRARFAQGVLVADADASMEGGRVDVRATFDVPARRGHAAVGAGVSGLAVVADGDVDGDAVAARVRVEARDLAAADRALARSFGLARIGMTGDGRIDAVIGGTTAAPSLRVTARWPALRHGDIRARDLDVTAWIPDLGAPEALDADVKATELSMGGGGPRLRAPTVAVHAAGSDVAVRAAVAGPQPLHIDLGGKRRPGREIVVDALSLRYPEATWTLRRPARLSLADGVTLSGFVLGADAQTLAVDLQMGAASPRARVTLSRFDLGRLPRALLPPSLVLAGRVDADVHATLTAQPRVRAQVRLAGGRVGGYRDLSFDLDAKLDRGRAHGALHAKAVGTAATARFDVPAEWPPRRRQAPLDVDVEIADADLAQVAAAAADAGGGKAPSVAGHARVSVKLDGRVGRPRLRIALAGRGLAVGERHIGDLSLTLNGEGDGALAVQISSDAPARTRLDVTTPLSLASILNHPPTGATLARTPFEVKGTLDRLPLALLAQAARYRDPVGGTLSATLSIAGTAAAPRGTLEVDVAGATTGRFPPTDARVEVGLEEHAIEARARVTRKSRALLAAETRLGAPLGALARPAELAVAPIRVRAVFGPYAVQRLGLPPVSEREPPRQLHGNVHADLTVDGTAGAPRVTLHAQASDVYLDKAAIGYAQIEAGYADRRAKVDARLTSHNGGTLRATVALGADLGYPAIARGLDVEHAPLDVRLDADNFDLAGLSGVTKDLRTVAGQLSASLTLRGTAADPRLGGRLDWKNGVVAITGFGEYKQIHLAVHGNEDQLVLDELSTASGSGNARVVGSGTHKKGHGYEVAATLKLNRFPVYVEGQSLATVSLTSRAGGQAATTGARLNIDIDDARVELTDAKRKELQPLQAPADVVLMDGGAPLNDAQAAKLKALLATDRGGVTAAKRAPALRLKVNAPRQLWVEGQDARLELGLSPDFRVSIGEPTQMFGQVVVHRGRVDLFGRRFDLKADSTLTFGGAPDRPNLDVRAEYTNDAEKLTVLITAKGPIDKLDVSVTAPTRPDLSESQLYTMIITGHLQLGGTTTGASSPSTQAASLLGGVLASKLQSTLAHRLPLDVFTIDVGGEGVRGTKLEAGRYVTERVYVGYIGRVGSDPTRYQNRNAVHLEYQISSRWEIEAEYGDLGTGTGDLMWKKNY